MSADANTDLIADMIPVLPRGVRLRWDRVRARHVLLGPERALMLDAVAYEVLTRIDGLASVATISKALAARFRAPPMQVSADVAAFLSDLAEKRLVDMRPKDDATKGDAAGGDETQGPRDG